MKKILDWWKQNKRYVTLCKAVLAALLPYLCCVVVCAVQGRSVGEVYLPGCEWNDELFYYKQVESVVAYGYPLGYYGFNESHALQLSFAAWSPVLVLPWIVWGMLFGWSLMSPVVCNIVLLTLAVFFFVLLARPTWKQTGVLALLFCLYNLFVRYMLSGMPEVICFSFLILFYGLALNYQRRETAGKLAGLFALSGLLTLMRPYMLLFLLLPVYFLIRAAGRKGRMWQGALGAAAILAAVLGGYAMIKHYLGAEYFHPLFFTDWITTFFTRGIGDGIHNFFGTLYWKGKDFCRYTLEGVRSGLASGAFFAGYLVMTGILLGQSMADWRRIRRGKNREQGRERHENTNDDTYVMFVTEAHLAFSFIGMLFALLLMYKLTEGSKHLLTFMAAGIFIVAMMKTKFYKKAVLMGAVFAYLYSYKAEAFYDYQIPFREPERAAQAEEWRGVFAAELELVTENVPNYDNVVIWVFDEQNAAGENMKWQLLYALPKGFGISCCQKDYVLEHFAEIQSRYIAAQTGAEVDEKCREAGCDRLAGDEDIVLYRLY